MAQTVILGSGGRLGAALQREWGAVGFTRAQLDVTDPAALEAALGPLDFDVLVNCAAQTNVDRCETHPEEAYAINRDAVRTIARLCSAKGARCVHISTDYVFDGSQRMPYVEEDKAVPISVYGESKRAGELALFEIDPAHLAVRVSWVFGPDRPSFIDQILQKAKTTDKVEAIGDKWAVPTYTLDIAQLLQPFLRERRDGGLLHLCNGGECTWQEYGQDALDCAREAGVALQAHTVGALKMAELKAFVAKRPVYTVMSTSRLAGLTGVAPRPWQEAVREYVRGRAAGL
jgi:dTDP-4-dehydrorhamnose reductase